MNRQGIEVHEVSPAEAAQLFPVGDFSTTLAAYWFPHEGRVNPVDMTMALARGARDHGTRILQDTRVEQILTAHGRSVGVRTDKGDIAAERERLPSEAQAQAAAVLEDGRARLSIEVADAEAKGVTDIASAQGRVGDEMRAEIARLSSAAVDHVVTGSLDDATQQELIENFIQRVGASQ
jgi:hypothetical protein